MGEFKTVLAVDFFKPAIECYKANFPDVDSRYADIRSIKEFPDADVVIGGPPCQPFSAAGKQRGTNDPRNMIPEFIRCISQVKPRQFLMENVKGFYQSPYRDEVVNELEGLGYNVEFRLLNSADYGVPQSRQRVFIWGIRNDIDALHQWPFPTHKDNPVTIRQVLGERVGVYHVNNYPGNKHTEPANPNKPCATLRANFNGKDSNWVWVDESISRAYHMTPDDALRIMSVPSYFKWAEKQSKSSKWHIVGNGWASKMGTIFAEAFKKVDPQSYTVIDLFCGGGLGAIGWHDWQVQALKKAG